MPTPQEEFWIGDFGSQYTQRCRVDWAARIPFWNGILARTNARSILDVGCNAGWNLRALRTIDDMLCLWGCDVNASAVEEASDAGLSVIEASLFDLSWWHERFDLVAHSGVLIHVAPEDLQDAMEAIIARTKRYVLAVEYAADEEEEIPYRGYTERLWKRPFGKLYEDLGLKIIYDGEAPADAFDRCYVWLMERT